MLQAPISIALHVCVALFFVISAPATLVAQARCTPLNADIPFRSTLASAGFFANLRNADHSVRFLMDQLLTQSESKASEVAQQEHACTRPCSNSALAVVFSSTPNITLPDYDEHSTCQKLYETTQKDPIVYNKRAFASQEKAEEWYNDLTQGNGVDGADLYERCPGKCSPAYTSLIYKQPDTFIVSTSIVCGHARDKGDGQYRLDASLRWICS